MNCQVAGRTELIGPPVRARLSDSVVDRRGLRYRVPRREEPEVSGGRRFGHRRVDHDRGCPRRDSAAANQNESPVLVREESRPAVGTRGFPGVHEPTRGHRVEARLSLRVGSGSPSDGPEKQGEHEKAQSALPDRSDLGFRRTSLQNLVQG